MSLLQIGNTYRVPCAVYISTSGKKRVVPIYYHLHDDAENGQYHPHYHADTRFISGKHMAITAIRLPADVQIKVYKRRLYRLTEQSATRTQFISKSNLNWDNVKQLKCPHKGYDLSNIQPDCNNIITCPLHGIKIKLNEKDNT